MTKRRRRILADPFDVWGKPPLIVLDQLGRKDHDRLRRYIIRVVGKVYKIAYECGQRSRTHGEQSTAEGGVMDIVERSDVS